MYIQVGLGGRGAKMLRNVGLALFYCVYAGPVYLALTCDQTYKSSTAVRKTKVVSAAE